MINSDTHLHSSFSSDSDAPMESMIQEGIRRNMKTLCFTEHFDPCYPVGSDGLDFQLDFESYKDTLYFFKEKYASEIEILYGLELGVQPHLEKEILQFYEKYGKGYDFIINSCHVVDGIDPWEKSYFETRGEKKGVMNYFETILANIKIFPHCQTVGHLDYVRRYLPDPSAPFNYADYGDVLDEILKEIIHSDRGLEVNTAGLKYGMSYPNPHLSILKRYRELGGEIITIGSDGHCPEHMAWDFDKLPAILKEAGFDRYAVFRNKCPQFYEV